MKQFTSLGTLRSNQSIYWLGIVFFMLAFSSVIAQNDSIPKEPYNVFDADRDYNDFRYNRAQSAFLKLDPCNVGQIPAAPASP